MLKTVFCLGLLNGEVSLHSLVSPISRFFLLKLSAESSIRWTTLRLPLGILTLISKMDFSLKTLVLISLWYLFLLLWFWPLMSLLLNKNYNPIRTPGPLTYHRWVRRSASSLWGCNSLSWLGTSILRLAKTGFAFFDLIARCLWICKTIIDEAFSKFCINWLLLSWMD